MPPKSNSTSSVASKRKSSPTAAAGAVSKKERSPNFTDPEDQALCKAFMNCSEDPITGCDQDSKTFWQKIKEKYDPLIIQWYQTTAVNTPSIEEPCERDWKALKARYTRSIMPNVNYFLPIFRRHYDRWESGKTLEEIIEMACEEWFQTIGKGKPFKYLASFRLLKDFNKFNIMLGKKKKAKKSSDGEEEGEEESEESTTNEFLSPMGAGKPRPMGNKAAKAAVKAARVSSRERFRTRRTMFA